MFSSKIKITSNTFIWTSYLKPKDANSQRKNFISRNQRWPFKPQDGFSTKSFQKVFKKLSTLSSCGWIQPVSWIVLTRATTKPEFFRRQWSTRIATNFNLRRRKLARTTINLSLLCQSFNWKMLSLALLWVTFWHA